MTRIRAALTVLGLELAACGSQTAAPEQGTGGAGGALTGAGTTGAGAVNQSGGLAAGGNAGSSMTGSGGDAGAKPGGAPNAAGGSGTAGGGGAAGNAGSGAGNAAAGSGGVAGSGGSNSAGSAGMAGNGSAGASGQDCAGRATLGAGDSKLTLQHGGRARSYTLHVPSGLTSTAALAIVIDLHGAGGSGSQQKGLSGFAALADKKKFLGVFPDGVDGYWNVDDTCCGTAGKQKIDDVGFVKAIISKLKADTCIDSSRVYVSGFSNGGGLAHRMGCDAADVIAAVAPMSTDLRTQPCKPVRPISMLEVRGMADSLEPYAGGLVGPEGGQYTAVGAKASLKLWADIDQCTGSTSAFETYCERYTQCSKGVEAALCSLPNVDHSPYNNALHVDVAAIAWSMFERQPMK